MLPNEASILVGQGLQPMKPSLALLLFLAAAPGACKSPSTYYDHEIGMRAEELGMACYKFGSGKDAFDAQETSAIGPCFITDTKAFRACEKSRRNEPDQWRLSYTSSIKPVSKATVDSWNEHHASDNLKASLDEDGLACIETDVTFTENVRLNKKEFFRQFARKIREFNAFLKNSRR
jgi:hypothetical protein